MMKILCFLVGSILLFSVANADDGDIVMSGQIGISASSGSQFVNFGGPSVRVSAAPYTFAVGFFPSLRHIEKDNQWMPILGMGPSIGWGKVFLIAPSYFYSANWYTSIGLSYQF